ncbi:uncharacterized protein RAG0_02208 [Rhynchosporium agropyri]|uniref:Nuclear GTPase SLIP-GC n=1 Tax=Rhynchosporium agropyri TaxID=914238 RepID=A0A1E1K538_9HELO|nr:uncharacterized protein RAG0_02208 [Rhynchosporium agropyri]
MAEATAGIKLEPSSASVSYDEPEPLFCAQLDQNLATETPQPETTIPLWRNILGRDRKQMVFINEEAAEHANRYFMAVKKILREFAHISSTESRLDDIKGIYARRKQCKARIGFLGGTGTGKSSLINALLMERVLPRSEEAASTAVPVEVSYNDSEDPERLYRAYIEGISREEFTNELEGLFADKMFWDQGEGLEAGDVDFEMLQRMNTTFSKIKCLFPKLQTLDDLKKTSAQELLSNPEVSRLLDSKQDIFSADFQNFANSIKRYIEANKGDIETSLKISVWPLVKLVRIRTKAAILKPGIILVDLPGNQDTSAARNAIAEQHKKNLTMSVIVAPAVRASSDKGAYELLSSAERRTMQLDGLYKSDSLFFVVTKIDQLEDYDSYIKDHQNMDRANIDALKTMDDLDTQIDRMQREFRGKSQLQTKLEKDLEKYGKAHDKLTTQVEKILDQLSLAGAKRKRIEDSEDMDLSNATESQKKTLAKLRQLQAIVSETSATVSSGGNDLYRIQSAITAATYNRLRTECYVKAACIENRNQVHRTQILAEFKAGRAMMGKKTSTEKDLRIFSVSSNVFARLNGRNGRDYALQRGFLSRSDTGIPALREALLATTWENRERNARSFNEDAESSLTRMKLWVSDKAMNFKMSCEERKHVESRLGTIVDELETKFSKLHAETSKEIKHLIQTGILAKLAVFSKVAAQQAKGIVTNWALVPWNTHRATNKRHGVWQSGTVSYDWNDELAGNYLELLMVSWTKTIHNKINELQRSYDRHVEATISEFSDVLLASAQEFDPTVDEAIHLLKENVLRLSTVLQNSGADVFAEIITASKNAHRLVQPGVISAWEDVYTQCGDETGTGTWVRNRQAHQNHVKGAGGLPMYKSCGFAIKAELKSACDDMFEKFETNYNDAVGLVKEDLRVMLERHTADLGLSAESVASLKQDMLLLQQALAPVFAELERAWGIEPIPEVADEDEGAPEPEAAAKDEDDNASIDLDELLKDES